MVAYCAMELGDKQAAKTQLAAAATFPELESKANEVLLKLDEYMP